MSTSLRVLILEDQAADAELMVYELGRAGFEVTWTQVDTKADYLAHLQEDLDVILVDYTLPQFNALDALRLLQERNLDMPVIVVTGSISEEAAVACMKQGAADYLLKDRLARLGPAVTHALHERKLRGDQRWAEAEREKLALELQQQIRLLDAILATTPEHFHLLDRHGRYLYASPPALQSLGLQLDDVVGQTWRELGLPADIGQSFEARLARVFQSGQPVTAELSLPTAQGTKYYEQILSPFHDATGAVASVVSTTRDITERKQAEEALRQAQKMESLGILAGGVAHDFNNLLTAMMAQTSLALNKLSVEHPARPNVEKATTATQRAADLTRQLLAYSGRGHFEVHPIHLNTLIQENLHLFEVAVPKNVQLCSELSDALPLIDADAGQMQQVIMNLIINAAEAMEDRPGSVIVKTGAYAISSKDKPLRLYMGKPLSPGRYATLEVHDNGCGMDEATLSRIFDPFFTTKFTGRGLGLAAVLGIVRGHRGGLQVQSVVNQGTIFRLFFPASAAASRPSAGDNNHAASKPEGVILVIDDEDPVREAVIDILEHEGLQVISAPDGRAGIALYEKRQGAVQLVILDLSMPGLSGQETFARLRQINPALPILLSSGYSQVEASRRFADLGVIGFLQKPYGASQLLATIQQYLA
jgi:PAS domain S-box-containing protein